MPSAGRVRPASGSPEPGGPFAGKGRSLRGRFGPSARSRAGKCARRGQPGRGRERAVRLPPALQRYPFEEVWLQGVGSTAPLAVKRLDSDGSGRRAVWRKPPPEPFFEALLVQPGRSKDPGVRGPKRRKLAPLVAVRRDVESAKRSKPAVPERSVEPAPDRVEGASVQSAVVDCCADVDDVGRDRCAWGIAEGVLGRVDEDSLRRRHADRAGSARAGPPRRATVEYGGEVERLLGAVAAERLGEQVRFVLGLLDRLGALVAAALPPSGIVVA